MTKSKPIQTKVKKIKVNGVEVEVEVKVYAPNAGRDKANETYGARIVCKKGQTNRVKRDTTSYLTGGRDWRNHDDEQ